MPGPLKHQTWLTLRGAAREIGRELIGHDWTDEILNRSPRTDRTLRDLRSDLIKVLDSKEVAVHLDDGERRTPLDPRHLHHVTTYIDLAEDTIVLGDFPGLTFRGLVNAKEFIDFLKQYRPSRFEALSPIEKHRQCVEWLTGLMKKQWKDNRPCKDKLREEANRKFGIAKKSFHEAWSEAIEKTGSGWDRPGRPKSSRKSSRSVKN